MMSAQLHEIASERTYSPPSHSSTKGRILGLLKRRNGCTVDQLAGALSVVPMTVRQHLATLERDGLVCVEGVRGGPGRPRHLYRLTERGEESFPKRYDQLAAGLLHEVGQLEPAELRDLTPAHKQDVLLGKLAVREAARLAPALAGKDLPERVATLARLLEAEGGMTEWGETLQGFEIREYNCVYRRVALQQPAVCAWHAALLGEPVTCDQPMIRGSACCRFEVKHAGAESAPTTRRM